MTQLFWRSSIWVTFGSILRVHALHSPHSTRASCKRLKSAVVSHQSWRDLPRVTTKDLRSVRAPAHRHHHRVRPSSAIVTSTLRIWCWRARPRAFSIYRDHCSQRKRRSCQSHKRAVVKARDLRRTSADQTQVAEQPRYWIPPVTQRPTSKLALPAQGGISCGGHCLAADSYSQVW